MEGKIMALVLGLVILLVGVVIVYSLLGGFAPTLVTTSTQISNSGLPLAGLFSINGIVFIVLMAVILLALIFLMFSVLKRKGGY
jgi:uncharacterized BrkB/YihY/UPF0761 family membrane protein